MGKSAVQLIPVRPAERKPTKWCDFWSDVFAGDMPTEKDLHSLWVQDPVLVPCCDVLMDSHPPLAITVLNAQEVADIGPTPWNIKTVPMCNDPAQCVQNLGDILMFKMGKCLNTHNHQSGLAAKQLSKTMEMHWRSLSIEIAKTISGGGLSVGFDNALVPFHADPDWVSAVFWPVQWAFVFDGTHTWMTADVYIRTIGEYLTMGHHINDRSANSLMNRFYPVNPS